VKKVNKFNQCTSMPSTTDVRPNNNLELLFNLTYVYKMSFGLVNVIAADMVYVDILMSYVRTIIASTPERIPLVSM